MTVYERTQQLERRKTIAAGIAGVAIVGIILGGCSKVASNSYKGIDEMLATETEEVLTETFEATAEPTEEVEIACVEVDIVAEPTEEVEETEVEEEKPSYTKDDLTRLARLIYFEDSQCEESMMWCGSVVLNRVASKKYPNTIKGVIHQKGQFSVKGYYMTRKVDKKLYAKCEAVAKTLLESGSVAPKEVVGMSHIGTYKKYHKKLYKKFGKVYYYSVR